MKTIHIASLGLIVGVAWLLLAGCTPTPQAAPEKAPAAAPALPTTPATAPAPEGPPVAESAPNPAAPTAAPAPVATTPAENAPLPEVLAVNTAQVGGLVEKTLGKVLVLNIWATWCPPCVHEMPELVEFYNSTDRSNLAFLSISVDSTEDITKGIPEFQRAHQVPFPIFVLNERNDEGLVAALRGKFSGGIPTTMIYDRQGKIVKQLEGAITLDELRTIVNPLLEAKP